MRKGDQYMDEEKKVDTGGGAYIGGGVQITKGDFVGRDKIVKGDKVHGDMVGGDKITVGDISGSTGVAIGRGAQATVTSEIGGQELAQLFADVYRRIEFRSEEPGLDKADLIDSVQRIEREAAKGEEANPLRVERWLRFLGDMAPDILEVAAATLASPVAGVAIAIRKVAKRSLEEERAET
jgi:hypothetical protein